MNTNLIQLLENYIYRKHKKQFILQIQVVEDVKNDLIFVQGQKTDSK